MTTTTQLAELMVRFTDRGYQVVTVETREPVPGLELFDRLDDAAQFAIRHNLGIGDQR